MDTIFTLGDASDTNTKLNLDELYEKKQQHDLNTLNVYNKILNRIHSRIRVVSRQTITSQFCWFVIPEMIIGVPKYDHGACTAYIIDKLNSNGFMIRYTHPNLLFISWKHWVPSYVRNEIKKKTGVIVDGYGNQIDSTNNEKQNESKNPDDLLLHRKDSTPITSVADSKSKDFKKIDAYIPSGNLIYNQALLKKIEDRSKS